MVLFLRAVPIRVLSNGAQVAILQMMSGNAGAIGAISVGTVGSRKRAVHMSEMCPKVASFRVNPRKLKLRNNQTNAQENLHIHIKTQP
jgi:hypothetical protein